MVRPGSKYPTTPQANSYLFAPRVTEEQVAGDVLEDVVDRVFDGSTFAVLMKLFEVKVHPQFYSTMGGMSPGRVSVSRGVKLARGETRLFPVKTLELAPGEVQELPESLLEGF